jgi:aspartyl-tRNA(Asn)/glutamyl-tRNA(Gln) amidotransferase subunit A
VTDEEARAYVDDPAVRRAMPAVEAATGFLARIDRSQPAFRAFVTVTPELALADARRADVARAAGERLPLDGLPVAVKDNVDVAGVRTTVGSRLFADRIPTRDAPAVERLRRAGAVVLGKANLHELAFGATSRNEAFGAVVNPWAADRIPGGSSGGSGAAVAADLCVAAVGTDTGGSIRLPAAFCGVAGLRPALGAVPTEGVFPVSVTLDTVGPLARSVVDVAAVHGAMAGADVPVGPLRRGVRIGIPEPWFADTGDEVREVLAAAADVFRGLGAEVGPVALPAGAAAAEACGVLIRSEALAVHSEDLRRRPGLFEEGTRRRLALAETVTPAELARVEHVQASWEAAVAAAFDRVELLLCPATPGPAPPVEGADSVTTTAEVTPFTFALSLAGVPVLALPCGFTRGGLPLGLQLAAPPGDEGLVLATGRAYQAVTDWHRRRPPVRDAAQAGSMRTTS